MLRFALHRQGQDSQACTRYQAMAWQRFTAGPTTEETQRFGDRLPEVNAQPSTDSRKGFLPPLNNRVCTLGVSR
jgi:hypothetical protein